MPDTAAPVSPLCHTPMILGQVYRVPCARAVCHSIASTPLWLPVNGPLHDDREILEIEFQHWHLDWRFLTRKQITAFREKAYASAGLPREAAVFTDVITEIHPDLGQEWLNGRYESLEQAQQSPEELEEQGVPRESYLQLRFRRLNDEYPPYPREFMMEQWLLELEQAYQGHRLKDGLICPHKGGDLAGSRIVDGTVTCPLHGLRWNLATGELAPTAPTDQARP